MAFDSRRMRFFQGRVWQQQELDDYHAAQRAKRPTAHTGPIGKSRGTSTLMMLTMGLAMASSMAPPIFDTPSLPSSPSRGPTPRKKW